jgi:4-alpha-glucanotransferase
LEYDVFRRASFLDGLFPSGAAPDPLSPWARALVAVGERALECAIVERAGKVDITLAVPELEGVPLRVEKRVRVGTEGAALRVRHRLTWRGGEPLQARWATQLNLTLTAGEAPGRYYRIPDSPSLGSRGAISGTKGLALVDEWVGCEVELGWSKAGDAGWAPIETVSLSEGGFERIYQGSAILVSWPVTLLPGASWDVELRIEPRVIPRVS